MFLSPLFLFGLLAASIPLVLHLRRSTRHKRMLFSTTRFFDEQFIRSSRRAQFQDKVLMALRIALLALFVLALAQPFIKFPGLASWTGERRLVAVVIDDSASMSMSTERGVLLERSKGAALALVKNLSKARGDKATLVLAGRRETGPRVLFPEPTSDFDAIRAAINGVKVTDLATDLNVAVDRAGKVISGAGASSVGAATPTSLGGSREVYVFSDMQRSAFAPGQQLSAGPGVLLVMVSTAANEDAVRENLSVDAVQYGAPQPMLGVPFTFRTLLNNHSPRTRTATATLVVDGQSVGQKTVEIPGGRSKIVRFTHRFTKIGWFGGYVEVAPGTAAATASAPATMAADAGTDALAFDNRRFFSLRVDNKLRVLAINGAPSAVPANDELFFLRLALTVNPEKLAAEGSGPRLQGSPIQLETLPTAKITPDKLEGFPLVILANVGSLAPDALETLERYVDAGGNLFVTLGDRVDPNAYATWVGDSRLHGGLLPGKLAGVVTPAPAIPTLAAPDPAAPAPTSAPAPGPDMASAEPADAGYIASVSDEHPALAGFADGQLGSLTSVRFSSRYKLDVPADAVLMRSAAGEPLMAEKRFGRGRVLLFASSIDRDWTNFPLQPAFVPWVYRIVSYLAQGGLDSGGFVRTGQVVPLPNAATQVEALQVETPDGSIAYPEPAASHQGGSASGMVFNNAEEAGVYVLRGGGRKDDAPRLLFAANVPSDEADPVSLDRAAIANLVGSDTPWDFVSESDSTVDVGASARRGYGLWDQLLFLALMVGLFEPWLANRLTRRRSPSGPDAMSKRDVASRVPMPGDDDVPPPTPSKAESREPATTSV